MCPGTDPGLIDGTAPAELVAEGAGYAVALLHRIAADASSPADLVAVFQFLHHPAALPSLPTPTPINCCACWRCWPSSKVAAPGGLTW